MSSAWGSAPCSWNTARCRPPYVGHRGWLGVRLDRDLEWNEIAGAIEDAYLTVAPRSLIEAAGLAGRDDAG